MLPPLDQQSADGRNPTPACGAKYGAGEKGATPASSESMVSPFCHHQPRSLEMNAQVTDLESSHFHVVNSQFPFCQFQVDVDKLGIG